MSIITTLQKVLSHPLNSRRKTFAVARMIWWQARSRLGPATVKFVNQTRYRVHRGETGLTGNIYCGLQDFEEMSLVLHALRPGDVFVDVGANMGSYSMLAGTTGADIVAYEPHRPTFERLSENISINNFKARLECCGVGETASTARLSQTRGTMNQIDEEGELISMKSIDDDIERATILKVDVEGYEVPVFRGAKRVLSDPGLLAVLFEHSPHNQYGFEVSEIHQILAELGFRPFRYDPLTRTLSHVDVSLKDMRPTANWIFARSEVADRLASSPKFSVHGHQV